MSGKGQVVSRNEGQAENDGEVLSSSIYMFAYKYKVSIEAKWEAGGVWKVRKGLGTRHPALLEQGEGMPPAPPLSPGLKVSPPHMGLPIHTGTHRNFSQSACLSALSGTEPAIPPASPSSHLSHLGKGSSPPQIGLHKVGQAGGSSSCPTSQVAGRQEPPSKPRPPQGHALLPTPRQVICPPRGMSTGSLQQESGRQPVPVRPLSRRPSGRSELVVSAVP